MKQGFYIFLPEVAACRKYCRATPGMGRCPRLELSGATTQSAASCTADCIQAFQLANTKSAAVPTQKRQQTSHNAQARMDFLCAVLFACVRVQTDMYLG